MTELATIEEKGIELAAGIQELETRFAMAVRQRELLETYIKERLKPQKHFYKVGGSSKDSLTKEGAELVCLAHAYKPRYEILSGPDQPSDNDTPYQITVRCSLMQGQTFAGEGLGSANSHVTKRGGDRVVRQPDIGLRHNATLKMAEKSAYIAATLNATAASEFFTQDMEDMAGGSSAQQQSEQGRGDCPFHNVPYGHRTGKTAKGPYDFWACPEKVPAGNGTGRNKDYCPNTPDEQPLQPHGLAAEPTGGAKDGTGPEPPTETQLAAADAEFAAAQERQSREQSA